MSDTALWYEPSERHYKYRTTEERTYPTGWTLPEDVSSELGLIHLSADGVLTIKAGYRWDGASGPTFDTPSTMFASLVHDALYQLMREEAIGQEWRLRADDLLGRIMKSAYRSQFVWWDRASAWAERWHRTRVRIWVWGVKKMAAYAARPE